MPAVDALGFVAGELGGDGAGHALALHIADGCALEIVDEVSRHARRPARGAPSLSEAGDAPSAVAAGEVREDERDDAAELALQGVDPGELLAEEPVDLRAEVDDAPFPTLGGAKVEAQRPCVEVDVPPLQARISPFRQPKT